MKHNSIYLLFIILSVFPLLSKSQNSQLPRLLITTDIGGDPDDQQSLIRLLLYANEFEIEGLIASATGTPGELNKNVIKPELIEEILRAYSQVHQNLTKHDLNFPSPSYLFSVVKKGNPYRSWENIGEGHDTEGSDWIIYCLDKKDPRPLNIAIWGGQTDLAQALWKVKHSRTSEEYRAFISKIRVHDIMDQDRIFAKIWEAFPGIFYILNKAPEGEDKRNAVFRGMYLGGPEELTSLEWIKENVAENHGPMGALYPLKTWTKPNPHGVMKEGDTPSWFFFLENRLNSPEHPEFGGWGGRFLKNKQGYYEDASDTFEGENNARATVYRWRSDFQNEFASRMDWCTSDFREANHSPVPVVDGVTLRKVMHKNVKSGQKINLNAIKSSDPDGNILSYYWWIYRDVSTSDAVIEKNNAAKVKIAIPKNAPDGEVHIMLEVKDNGAPSLTSYQRIVLHVGE
jgi:hypothetical protein